MQVKIDRVSLELGGRRVLDGITAELEPGLTLVVGPNGAGKTSMLRCMSGLREPRSGRVLYNGHCVHMMSTAERAKQIAYLPQFPSCCWPLSVRRVVELGRFPHRQTRWLTPPRDDTLITNVLERLHLAHLQHRSISTLSGGERQRVMLARALVTDPGLLLLDEPVTGFDPAQQISLMHLLKEVADDGRIIVAIMHDLALVQRFADRVIVLHEGEVKGMGAPAEVLAPALLEQVFALSPDQLSLYLPQAA